MATQIRSLEAEEDRNQEAVKKLELELHEHWATYASFHCRVLCDQVREKLPKELRIMIFDALWADAHHTITDWNAQALGTTVDDPMALVESWSNRNAAHCFDPRFVGPALEPEIREAWWHMSVFEIKTFDLIPNFLSECFWGGDVKGKVRNVVVNLTYRERIQRYKLRPFTFVGKIRSLFAKANLEEELEYLFELSRSTKITLTIKKVEQWKIAFTVGQRQDEFLRTASRLFPALKRLEKEGYTVRIVIDKDITVETKNHDITMEDWREQIGAVVKVRRFQRYAASADIYAGS